MINYFKRHSKIGLKTCLMMIGMLLAMQLYAQQRTVTGTITDQQGETMPGVNILIKGTTTGVVSDIDGKFSINVPDGNTVLQISFVGYVPQEITVGSQMVFQVILDEMATELDEVVVIGYGTVRRKDLTGSVSSVGSDAIAAIPVSSAVEAISGKLAGVQITSTEGSPDAEMKIRVRGGGSITGSNTPLMIVDGFPVESISDIPPTDIESIDVLKDASSTAIYGSRGANGVIIVTTKSGKEGKVSVSYNAYVGWKKIAKTLDVLSPADYVKWQYERAMLDDGKPDVYTKYFGNYQDIDIYNDVPANDWQKQVFGRTGFTFNQNLSINGGGEKTKYAFSYSHINDKAIMQLSGFKRDNLSLKLNNKPHKRVDLDFSIRYSNTEIDGSGANEQNEKSSADSRLKNAMIYPPIPVSGLTDSGETDDSFNLYDPLESISDNDRQQNRINYNLNGGVAWEIIDNLKIRTEVGMDDYRYNDDRFYGKTTYYVKNTPIGDDQGKPAVILSRMSRRVIRNTNTLNYNFKKILHKDHSLNILLGQEYIYAQEENLTSTVHGFPASFDFDLARKLTTLGNANSVENFYYPDDKLLSFFGRVNYDYQSKYLLSATFRADGSSKFGDGNKWGYFPSVSAAWRISSESFMEPASSWLYDLKLRASYGTAGNNNIPSGQITPVLYNNPTNWVNGVNNYWGPSKITSTSNLKIMSNPDLIWETTVTRNLGLDISTLRGRLSGTVEVYLNTTKDLLMLFPVSGAGYDNQYRNMGKTQNKGLEVSVNWIAIDHKDYGLNISGNIGFNRNKIKSLGQMNDFSQASGWASTEVGADYWIATGGQVGEMYGFRNDGRYEVSDFTGYDAAKDIWTLKDGVVDSSPVVGDIRPGTMKLKNMTEGDNLVNEADKVVIGNANPLHTGGLTINGRAYGFDLSASFNWSYGNKVYNANKIEYTSTSKYSSRNMISVMADGERWNNLLPDGTICNDPAQLEEMNRNTSLWSPFMKAFTFTDWAVEDGSFLRLNTLTVGYTLPQSLMQKIWIKSCRFYVSGYNVFCWTNYSGFDPEVSTRRKTELTPGVDYSAYPKSRSIILGVNLNF